MRVLLDTNIIIHREASKVVNKDIGTLFKWFDRLSYEKCVHPLSREEIMSYHDPEVVRTMAIKIENYHTLQTESPETDPIKSIRRGDQSRNAFIDTSLLKEVLNGRVHFLVTEDRGIHGKADRLGISEKVFTIDSFLEKVIAENPDLKDYSVLSVKKEFFGNINIGDTFFDSFKGDYEEFEAWFNSKSDKVAYICYTDGEVKAFLYLKVESTDENYRDITPQFDAKKRLKIGTFKVESTGFKLGERFLKIIFDNAIQYQVDEIYVTIFNKREEQKRLIQLIEDWGFKYWGEKSTSNGTEDVFVKPLNSTVDTDNPKISYPYVSKSNQGYIVPIYPSYHTDLFPDSILNNESPADFSENEPHRNAIQKVYICRSINRDLHPGDPIIFYRTGGYHKGVISTLGVVENVVHDIKDENHFIQLCRKRSVFDDEELKKHWNWNPRNRPFITNFLYICSFPTPKINLLRLKQEGLVNDAPRGFEPISQETFEKMLNIARANENYIVN